MRHGRHALRHSLVRVAEQQQSLTDRLRRSDDEAWAALRRLLADRNIDARAAVIAEMTPDGLDLLDGGAVLDGYTVVIVTGERKAFVFRLARTWPDEPPTWLTCRWSEVTESWKQTRLFQEQIRAAFEELDRAR